MIEVFVSAANRGVGSVICGQYRVESRMRSALAQNWMPAGADLIRKYG